MYKYFILILIILTGCKEKKIEKSNQISRTPKILKQSPSSNLTKEKLLNDKNVIPFLNDCFFQVFGGVWTYSDLFGYIRMHSEKKNKQTNRKTNRKKKRRNF